MNNDMAYLLGMICGNGSIQRDNKFTTFQIDIPHKTIQTKTIPDVKLFIKASLDDIRKIIQPMIGVSLVSNQEDKRTVLSFKKYNNEYLTTELMRLINRETTHNTMRIHDEIFLGTRSEKLAFLKGFADVTGYIRRSNNERGIKYRHRVYIEIPHNWYMVIDICNLLKSIDIPVQNIDWAHPNMRDGNVRKYNEGSPNFWKKEHQVKIWANEFLPVGFCILHKNQELKVLSNELEVGIINIEHKANSKVVTHRYYWQLRPNNRLKPSHPSENDSFIPIEIRGRHFNSWREIAQALGYDENS